MLITYTAKLLSKRELCKNIYYFSFSYPDDPNWTYKAGQYMIFHIPQKATHAARRLYSMASPTYQKSSLDFVIEMVPNGIASTYLSNLDIGGTVTLQGPAGIFVMKESPRPIIFLATGTGIAPIRSIIESLLNKPTSSDIVQQETQLLDRLKHLSSQKRLYLFWGLKYCKDIYFLEEFKKLMNQHQHLYFKFCLSRQEKINDVPMDFQKDTVLGRVTKGLEDLLIDRDLNNKDFDYYLCGGDKVVQALREYLAERGIPKEQVMFEKFTT